MDTANVIFVLSTNYAGSHLLAHLLGAHSRCAGVGELHNYRKFRERGARSRDVVDDYAEHPAFAGLDRLPLSQWHGIILRRLRTSRPALTHLVDNSKRPAWARRFAGGHAYHVHLIRDPRALVSRWLRTYPGPEGWRRQRTRVLRRRPWALGTVDDAVGTYLQKWLITNRAISRFLGDGIAPIVTYRDLTLSTEAVLERLMPLLDLTFEPAQLGFADGVLGTRKRDYADGDSTIDIDLRWQNHLSTGQRAAIERHRGVERYLRSRGLVMVEDGLTRA